MRSLLYDPLGMPQTTHDPVTAMTYPLAQHHALADGQPAVIHRPLAGSKWQAGSQCYSTLAEMARFGSWLLRDLRATVTPRIDQPIADLRLDIGTHYGLGCYLTRLATGEWSWAMRGSSTGCGSSWRSTQPATGA
jgi:CubicO group peptidase (beta-lactamase class C family)